MTILRDILAIILGYAIFVISAVLLFKLSGVEPHQEPSIGFMIASVAFGMAFSFAGGFVTQLLSKSASLVVNYALAFIIAAFAAFSMFETSGNHYSQIAAIFVFAPASILGGLVRLRRTKNPSNKVDVK
jgi:hypothetical protein